MEIEHVLIDTPLSTRINKSYWITKDLGFICGGEKSKEGYIYKTWNGGLSWTKSYTGNSSLYDIIMMNDTLGFCCGENMEILKTIDKGSNWQKISKTNNSDKFYTGSLYGIFKLGNKAWFFGGRNFNVGFINRAQGDSMLDGFKKFNNELRCGIPINNSSYFACGYGQSYKTVDNSLTFTPSSLIGDYFTSSYKINNTISVFSGYNGGIFVMNNETDESTQIFDSKKDLKKQFHFNSVYFVSETKGWVAGNEGVLLETNDRKKFRKLDLKTTSNILSIADNHNNELILSTDKGELIRIAY